MARIRGVAEFGCVLLLAAALLLTTCAPSSSVNYDRFNPQGKDVSTEQAAQLLTMPLQLTGLAYKHALDQIESPFAGSPDSACVEVDSVVMRGLTAVLTKGKYSIRFRLDSLNAWCGRRLDTLRYIPVGSAPRIEGCWIDSVSTISPIEFAEPKWTSGESLDGSTLTCRYTIFVRAGRECDRATWISLFGTLDGFFRVSGKELVVDSFKAVI